MSNIKSKGTPLTDRISELAFSTNFADNDENWALYDSAKRNFDPGADIEQVLTLLKDDHARCAWLLGNQDGYNSYHNC